jgi:biopolymer transport protein ExbD
MKVRSPLPHKKARIEIIPLIDIMFFLLASFMMVSLSQTHMKGIRVNLPSANAPPPPPNTEKDYVAVQVSAGNVVYFDNVAVSADQILPRLFDIHKLHPDKKVSISADKLALHGDVIDILDKARQVGIEKIGYQIKTLTGEPGGAPAPAPGAAPPPPPKP